MDWFFDIILPLDALAQDSRKAAPAFVVRVGLGKNVSGSFVPADVRPITLRPKDADRYTAMLSMPRGDW
jgi:hypothetical protein